VLIDGKREFRRDVENCGEVLVASRLTSQISHAIPNPRVRLFSSISPPSLHIAIFAV